MLGPGHYCQHVMRETSTIENHCAAPAFPEKRPSLLPPTPRSFFALSELLLFIMQNCKIFFEPLPGSGGPFYSNNNNRPQ
jgi:hypothetical protein